MTEGLTTVRQLGLMRICRPAKIKLPGMSLRVTLIGAEAV